MNKEELLETFKIEDILNLPAAITKLIEGDLEERNNIYLKLLEINNFNVSYDWFQAIYEEDFAQRKQSKQDFTPNTVGKILSKITGDDKGRIYEPTAGNGSLLISNWWHRCLSSDFPLMHFPSDHMVECWELSNRAIPVLLLNLSIRGIMGVVYHGDVLEQTIKSKYILLNRNNDTLAFSEIIKDKDLNLKITEI